MKYTKSNMLELGSDSNVYVHPSGGRSKPLYWGGGWGQQILPAIRALN